MKQLTYLVKALDWLTELEHVFDHPERPWWHLPPEEAAAVWLHMRGVERYCRVGYLCFSHLADVAEIDDGLQALPQIYRIEPGDVRRLRSRLLELSQWPWLRRRSPRDERLAALIQEPLPYLWDVALVYAREHLEKLSEQTAPFQLLKEYRRWRCLQLWAAERALTLPDFPEEPVVAAVSILRDAGQLRELTNELFTCPDILLRPGVRYRDGTTPETRYPLLFLPHELQPVS